MCTEILDGGCTFGLQCYLGQTYPQYVSGGDFMYFMKIKFPTPGGVGEVQGDPLQSRRCYVEAVRKGQKRGPKELLEEPPREREAGRQHRRRPRY
ncbi:UNVERIFIED_CONTAM: hypothetical protein Slati_2239200 [Sesamum latifolium]|uniref:Uncharacterized protein n=1 Tax=Sesamum latifolium TaxID=2727402 RepID=A0AAW2WU55_9LAMI